MSAFFDMNKIYLLITGEKIRAFYSLRRLGKEAGLVIKKEDLPLTAGPVKIIAVDVDTML